MFPLKTKDQITLTFLYFKAMVDKQFSQNIKTTRTNVGIEFKPLVNTLENEGIEHRCICPHISEWGYGIKA